MSDNEDYFLDEDFLDDLDQTSQLYFSQLKNSKDDSLPLKRRKLCHETTENKFISKPNDDKVANKITELSSRKKLILSIFDNNSSTSNETKVTSAKASTSCGYNRDKTNPSSHVNSKQGTSSFVPPSSAKKLALEILDRNNSALKLNEEVDIVQGISNECSPELFKTPLVLQPKALVRKFPGPAGLIPDSLKDTLKSGMKVTLKDNSVDDAIYYLQNIEENEVSISKTSETTDVSEYCSQETEKLFSDGAWRRMLDDLPKNFLRGHDIASLHRLRRPNKVPLLAAFIHRIQHNAENPRILLKDISNSIEAIMHKDIPAKYPNILQSGVVLLLRDVGVLNFQGAQKYSTVSVVMIPSNSILGVYSDSERLVTTPALNEILNGDNCDVNTSEINYNTSRNKTIALELLSRNSSRSEFDRKKLPSHSKINREIVQQEIENIEPIENFDDLSDLDFDAPFVAFKHNSSSTIPNSNNSGPIMTKSTREIQRDVSAIHQTSSSLITPTINDDYLSQTPDVTQGSTISPTTGFADDLFDDTDDEILSQFDVDSIGNTYKQH